MSKIFEALNSKSSTLESPAQELAVSLQKPLPPEFENCWKEQYYPKFTEYKIEHFLDYLLSLHALGTSTTYGIVPVSSSTSIAQIVLETFMHFCANCDGRKLLADLSTRELVLQELSGSHAFDQPNSVGQMDKVSSVLHGLFHFLSSTDESKSSKSNNAIHYSEVIKLSSSYSFSMSLFPDVSKFNIKHVQIARKVENVILLCQEKDSHGLAKTGRFLDKLGVKVKGVYLFD